MNARTWGAGLVLMTLTLACEQGTTPSAPAASQGTRFSPSFSQSGGKHGGNGGEHGRKHGRRHGRRQEIRWDIVSIDFSNGNVSAGGTASALANDGSKITLTGSGTFELDDEGQVTGGGTWETFNSSATSTGNGTFRLDELVRFDEAVGSIPVGLVDRIGDAADAHGGLAVLQIQYSDGSRGILVVSCHLAGTPDDVFEGITASKGTTDFFNRVPPVAGVDESRTVFHLINGDED